MIKTLDHLIVAVSDINEAEKNYSKVFGIDPVWRGEHTEYGTENSLFNFNNTYFELLAAKGEGLGAVLVNHALQETGEGSGITQHDARLTWFTVGFTYTTSP